MKKATISNLRAFKDRFTRWMEGEGALDRELAESLSSGRQDPSQASDAESYAQSEAAREQRLHDMQQEEHQMFLRLHEWSQIRGVAALNWLYRALSLMLGIGVVWFLLSTMMLLPPFGEPNAPMNNEVAQRYIEKGLEETGAVNMVTGMILDYRAFDTFGESTVLFTAACSVILLLKLGDHSKKEPTRAMLEAEYDDRHHEPKNDLILQLAAKAFVPIILLFGIYVILNGHLSPGGGFSGGAVMGAGLILYLNAFGFEKTERFFTFKTFRWICFVALLTYGGLKSYSFYCGANNIPSGIPLGTPGDILSSGLILPLNICVGFIVMCTMYVFYTLFRKGGV